MSRREFPVKVRTQAALRAKGHCEGCGAKLPVGGFHYDHIDPDGLGGEPTLANCQVLCLPCHKDKTRQDTARMTKADNQRKRVALGIRPAPTRKIQSAPFPKSAKTLRRLARAQERSS